MRHASPAMSSVPDPRVERITELYGDSVMHAARSAVRTGWVLLVISGLFWAFFFAAISPDARAQQIFVPLGATAFAVFLLTAYPLAWVARRVSVEPRLRAFVEGTRVNGTIESIDTTNQLMPIAKVGSGVDPRDSRQLMKQIAYCYSIGGRVIRKRTPPFPPSLADGRSVGDAIAVYVFPSEPDKGEADVFRINEP
jgi:hypothetical protein